MRGLAEPSLRHLSSETEALLTAWRDPSRPERLRAWVEQLARPRNRMTGRAGQVEVQRFLEQILTVFGWEVERQTFTVSQEMARSAINLPPGADWKDLVGLEGVNLIARRPGRGQSCILAAHYDSLHGSPGADDNASALAVMLEVASLKPEAPLCLVCFDMEEWNLLGARHFVKTLDHPVEVAVVLESVGYLDCEPRSQKAPEQLEPLFPGQFEKMRQNDFRGDFTLLVYRQQALEATRRLAEGLAWQGGIEAVMMMRDPLEVLSRPPAELERLVREFGRSDHLAFWEAGLPALMVTDTADFRNPHYHKSSDLPASLNYRLLSELAVAVAAALTS
ncbi:MAG: M28 family peptidase [Candidatus Eremiobacteraeota bacterium]|nr:M28 family peptidase [Candidatus Eremiobacteraeota bacterium]